MHCPVRAHSNSSSVQPLESRTETRCSSASHFKQSQRQKSFMQVHFFFFRVLERTYDLESPSPPQKKKYAELQWTHCRRPRPCRPHSRRHCHSARTPRCRSRHRTQTRPLNTSAQLQREHGVSEERSIAHTSVGEQLLFKWFLRSNKKTSQQSDQLSLHLWRSVDFYQTALNSIR